VAGVYSTRFILHYGGAATREYIVPAGKVAVVKAVLAANLVSSPQTASLNISNVVVWIASLPGQYARASDITMVVVRPGEQLQSSVSSGNVALVVSGYLLDQL
jgi:hypothetical protein